MQFVGSNKACKMFQMDPSLELYRKELVVESGRKLDKARMIRFDERTGYFASTDLGRTSSHFYIRYNTIEVGSVPPHHWNTYSTHKHYSKPILQLYIKCQDSKNSHVVLFIITVCTVSHWLICVVLKVSQHNRENLGQNPSIARKGIRQAYRTL